MNESKFYGAFFWLAAIALLIATLVRLAYIKTFGQEPQWWFELASPLPVYGLLLIWVDKVLWKHPFFKVIGWRHAPDLNGKWSAVLKTSYDGMQSEKTAEIIIKQTWTSIYIWLISSTSKSNSEVATVTREKNGDSYLVYTYINEPSSDPKALTMHIHRGTCRLKYDEENNSLEGKYYSGEDRKNYGEIKAVKETNN